MLEIAQQIEAVKGETLTWDLDQLDISQEAWNRVIHRGIKPVVVFAHPEVLANLGGAVAYYRMLAMVSQKSMSQVGLSTTRFEMKSATPGKQATLAIAQHVNSIVSRLIEMDDQIDAREFDLWRGMAAGSQAQGSWQNAKGTQAENTIRDILRQRLREQDLVATGRLLSQRIPLKDGRIVVFAHEPDVGIYREERLLAAVEIKGGIDKAGVLERVGAALKSLSRIKEIAPEAVTILILQEPSVTQKSEEDLRTNQSTVNYWFTYEEISGSEEKRRELFELLAI